MVKKVSQDDIELLLPTYVTNQLIELNTYPIA